MILTYFIVSVVLSLIVLLIKNKYVAIAGTSLFLVLQIGFTFFVNYNIGTISSSYFTFDYLGALFLSLLTIISTASFYHGLKYFRNRITRRFFYYHAAFIGLIASITGAYIANDATMVWVLVEATTLCASVLIYHEKSAYALEATWKYIFLCSIGIAFAYAGILFISLSTDGLNDLSFSSIASIASNANPIFLKIAFVFVLIGYSTKMELFPMHTVGIDANSVSPTPIAALISTGLVNLGFLSIFRFYIALSSSPIFEWMNRILIISGMLSLLVAAGYMLKAKHNKRMLAYSTLENMGLVAIAIGLGGNGYYAAILLIILHSLTKSSLFFQLGQVARTLNTFKLDECGEYLKRNPAGGGVLLLGLFVILAIPPSGLFVSEFILFKTMIDGQQWFILISVSLLLTFVIYAMSTRFMHILFSKPRIDEDSPLARKVSSWESITQYIFLLAVISVCFYQFEFLNNIIIQCISVLPKL